MAEKTAQLQIRIRPDQKRKLKQLAKAASMDVSAWVLSRVLPEEAERFQELVSHLEGERADPFALADLADFLRVLPTSAFRRAVANAPHARLHHETLNHISAAIELAARRRGVDAPAWTDQVRGQETPAFGSTLGSVRLHLLTQSPVALRRRNLFMDASADDRV